MSETPYFNVTRRGNVITVAQSETPPHKQFPSVKIGGRQRYIMGGISGGCNVDALQWITDTCGEACEYDIGEYDSATKQKFMEFGSLQEVAPGIVRRAEPK